MPTQLGNRIFTSVQPIFVPIIGIVWLELQKGSKNENFSRPAALGGLHWDAQGFTGIIPVTIPESFVTITQCENLGRL